MTKWADYLISAVRYNADDSHITHVRVHQDLGTTVGSPSAETRQAVIDSIDAGRSFKTIYNQNGQWSRGEDVHVVPVNGVRYIRTDPDRTPDDNLGNLSRF